MVLAVSHLSGFGVSGATENHGTFGSEDEGGSGVTLGSGRMNIMKVSVSEVAIVDKLTCYIELGTGNSADVKGLIYEHNGVTDKPGDFLTQTSVNTSLIADSTVRWYDLEFATSYELSVGTYWIGYTPTGNINTKYGSPISTFRWAWNPLCTWSSPQDDPTGGTYLNSSGCSVYATY